MPQFKYTAKSREGKSVEGTVDASDRRGAIAAVERLGLVPITVAEKSAVAEARKKAARGHGGGRGGWGRIPALLPTRAAGLPAVEGAQPARTG